MRAATLIALALAAPACNRAGDAAVEPSTGVASGSAVRGRLLFLKYCAICHGERADGRGPRSGFERPPADFTSPRWERPEEATRVLRSIRDGLPGTSMPSWGILGGEAVADLTAYVLSVSRGSPPVRAP